MKRNPLHLAAAVAELARYCALVLLAAAFGALADEVSGLFRYAAAPQLVFAAGFFFLWRDPVRYAPYRPLLAAGEAVSLAALAPLALRFAYSSSIPGDPAGAPTALISLLVLAAADLGGFAVAAFARLPEPEPVPAQGGGAESVEAAMPEARGPGGAEA